MNPSNFATEVSRRLLPLIGEQAFREGKELNDPINSEFRRSCHLSKFNIIKLEVFSFMPLKDLRNKIKICALPFMNLPSSKLEGIP